MNRIKSRLRIVVEKTETGYSAYIIALSVFTTGVDLAELYANLLEAVNLACDDSGST